MKKKGFTLIELLAVIVILAIITVIAVPKILNVIEKAKESSAESSIKLAKDAIKTQIASANALGNSPFVKNADNCYEFDFDNQEKGNAKELKLKNKEKLSGKLTYCDNDSQNAFVDENVSFDGITIENSNEDVIANLNKFSSSEYKTKTTYKFNYTGAAQEFIAPENGFYKVELWGAGGGANKFGERYLNNQGRGAYTTGVTYLKKGTKLYIYVGQKGTDGISNAYKYTTTSFNGGGAGIGSSDNDDGGGAGGGATDIRLVSGAWNNFDSLKSRIMVAGGGAGGATVAVDFSKISAGSGGLTGIGSSWRYQNLENSTHKFNATQTSGYQFGIGENAVTAGNAGGSGAGGGYYGGFKSTDSPAGGAGGGSSYISGFNGCNSIDEKSTENNIIHTGNSKHYSGMYFVDTKIINGINLMPSNTDSIKMAGNKNNGFAQISLLEKGKEEKNPTNSKVYLYKEGIVSDFVDMGRVHYNHTVEYKDTYINTRNCGIKFENNIDLGEFSSLNFEIENTTADGFSRFYIGKTINVNAPCNLNGPDYYCIEDNSTDTTKKTITMDISKIKGIYNIYQNDYNYKGIKIYRVWLE